MNSPYTPRTKVQFCQRLGDTWKELADLLGVEPHERACFKRGEEARAIWERLEVRGNLDTLEAALAELNRPDLVTVLADGRTAQPVPTSAPAPASAPVRTDGEALAPAVRSDVIAVASPDRVVLADALLHGPAEATGAHVLLARADRIQAEDPDRAASAVQDAIDLLKNGGFAPHAALLVPRRAELLRRAERVDDSVQLLSDEFWRAIEVPDEYEAQMLLQGMRSDHLSAKATSLVSIAEHAMTLVHQPFGTPDIKMTEVDDAVVIEQARLALLAAQTAAIDPSCAWRTENAAALTKLADRVESVTAVDSPDTKTTLSAALRAEVADASGEWTALLAAARRHRPTRAVAAQVLARYAMHVAERGGHTKADQAWADAIEQGTLAAEYGHAAEWVHARRILSSRHDGINREFADSHRLVRSLYSISGGPPHQTERLRVRALRATIEGKPHVAVPALRSLLRIAISSGWWGQVIDVRQLLADAYLVGTEPVLAVELLIAGGRASEAEDLAKSVGDTYLDVRHYLEPTPAYWIPATALRVITTQADIVPDSHVGDIVDAAVDVLRRGQASTLADSPLLTPSVLLEAVKTLAALASRLPEAAATAVLEYLSPAVARGPNSYRLTDDGHVRLCVNIAAAHEPLRGEALTQLLDLLATADSGASQTVEHEAADVFRQYRDLVIDRLQELEASGNTSAAALIVLSGDTPSAAQMTDAATALARPSTNTAENMGIGTGAVRQSYLAMHLPADERRRLIAIQLDRAAAPYEPGRNRADYLLAAANLSKNLDDTDDLFDRAILAADDGNPSTGDLFTSIGNHPLGAFRVSGQTLDTRPHAVLLAAALARTPDQRAETRRRALDLLSVPRDSYFAVAALQRLAPADLIDDLPRLVLQTGWAARSLAALTWAASSPTDSTLGLVLARDSDVRVRRALAQAISATSDAPTIDAVRDVLQTDAHSSVRSLLRRDTNESDTPTSN